MLNFWGRGRGAPTPVGDGPNVLSNVLLNVLLHKCTIKRTIKCTICYIKCTIKCTIRCTICYIERTIKPNTGGPYSRRRMAVHILQYHYSNHYIIPKLRGLTTISYRNYYINHYTPNLPTDITPTNIARLKLSGKSSMGLEIPPLSIKMMLESNPLKSTMLGGRLGVVS